MRKGLGRAFLADAMLGRLARWLRLLGVPTLYAVSSLSDSEVLAIASSKRATLLTRDRQLHARAEKLGIDSVLLRDTATRNQLRKLFSERGLALRGFLARTRCPECGALLRPVAKSRVRGLVPALAYSSHKRFWLCSGCGKVYWRGAHWRRIRLEVGALRRALALRRARRSSALPRRRSSARRRA